MQKTYSKSELIAKNTQKYRYSTSSLNKLLNIDTRLVDLMFLAANFLDLKIVQGYRTPEQQQKLYREHKSTKDGYIKTSTHQHHKALDVLPLPKNDNMYKDSPENSRRWAYFTGFIQGLAAANGLKIRTGWKWRTKPQKTLERSLHENTFPDYNHIELKD